MSVERSHRDYLAVIGETCATAKSRTEQKWNDYYWKSFVFAVKRMLSDSKRGAVLDVGTSHGNWFPFLKDLGFQSIYGVELDRQRAEEARKCGYKEVFNCDAA